MRCNATVLRMIVIAILAMSLSLDLGQMGAQAQTKPKVRHKINLKPKATKTAQVSVEETNYTIEELVPGQIIGIRAKQARNMGRYLDCSDYVMQAIKQIGRQYKIVNIQFMTSGYLTDGAINGVVTVASITSGAIIFVEEKSANH